MPMTDEKKMEVIQACISDIQSFKNSPQLSEDDRLHVKMALEEYKRLYAEAEKGRIDPDLLHENISSFLYVFQ
jgi:hypothetical protein